MKRKEYVKSQILDPLFHHLSTQRQEEITQEIQTRHVVLMETSSDFTKTTNLKILQRRAKETLESLGPPSWRRSQSMDSFRTMELSHETMWVIHELWLDYIESIVKEGRLGISLETLMSLDLHGAQVEITRCKDPQLVSVEGIVFGVEDVFLWVLDVLDKRRRIPLRGSEIVLKLKSKQVKLEGWMFLNCETKRQQN